MLALLGAMLFLAPMLLPQVSAAEVTCEHITDSILPEGRERSHSTERPPHGKEGHHGPHEPFFMPPDGRPAPHRARSGEHHEGRTTPPHERSAPPPAGERTPLGILLFVVALAAVSVIITVVYVFGKARHRRE